MNANVAYRAALDCVLTKNATCLSLLACTSTLERLGQRVAGGLWNPVKTPVMAPARIVASPLKWGVSPLTDASTLTAPTGTFTMPLMPRTPASVSVVEGNANDRIIVILTHIEEQ